MSASPEREFNEAAFDEAFDRAAQEASVKYGFTQPGGANRELGPKRRAALVAAQAHTAREFVVEVQQWLYDDDPVVVSAARNGLRRVHEQIYVGSPDEHVGESGNKNLADRLITRLLGREQPDGPEPWWRRRHLQQSVRGGALIALVLLTAATASSIASHHLVVALAFLAAAGAIDIGEGAFARVVKLRSAILRWESALLSHFGDLLMIGAIAVAQVRFDDGLGSWPVTAALLFSLFGALVRVSALQAGYRFWVSRRERYVRYSGIISYCLLALAGYSAAGAYICAVAVGLYGVFEGLRVLRDVVRSPHARTVGVVLMDDDNTLLSCEFLNDTCDDEAPPSQRHGSTV